MDTDAKGQLGGMDASKEVREKFALQSPGWKCGACGKRNEEVMVEQDEAVREAGGEQKGEETVPEELRLQFREDLGKGEKKEDLVEGQAQAAGAVPVSQPAPASVPAPAPTPTSNAPPRVSALQSPPAAAGVAAAAASAPQQQRRQPQRQVQQNEVPAWIDKAIWGVVAALVFLVAKKIF